MGDEKVVDLQRIDAILQNAHFQSGLCQIETLEVNRIFCRHGLSHLLDVARIAWIMVLEQQISLEKDIVYGAALLHDLGRYRQYTEQMPHHQASAELAAMILPEAGYTVEETKQIVDAIRQHGSTPQQQGQLAQILYDADKRSRNCFQCKAQAECKWTLEQRNKTIVY